MRLFHNTSRFRAGDWVEVRSKDEILRTLDKRGQIEGLPFMPEMFQYCGKRFRVWTRAHKTCDTVNKTGGRSLKDSVHLESLRCDGAAHGGCQAACLIFWKESWLKRVGGPEMAEGSPQSAVDDESLQASLPCVEADVIQACVSASSTDPEHPVYVCQATQLPEATKLLSSWDFRQYWEDYVSGNVSLGRILHAGCFATFERLLKLRIGGRFLRRLYDAFQAMRGGSPYPRGYGLVPPGVRTPSVELNLQPGEWVRIKSFPEILATLDGDNKNRGLYFDAEEVPYCGGTYRVQSRVDRILDEKTGKLIDFKTPSVILEDVYCQARYSCKRLFCPRAIYPMWREVWLERVNEPGIQTACDRPQDRDH